MADFTPLNNLLSWDFSQLRANNGKATDEALKFFTGQLNTFFDQFKENNPSKSDIQQFNQLMDQVLAKINHIEVAYHQKLYANNPEALKNISSNCEIKLKQLPIRMQFWAATEEFGGAIRNAKAHRMTVNYLNKWPMISSTRLQEVKFRKFDLDVENDKNAQNTDKPKLISK